jgi:uncharacterized protein
MHGFSKFAFIVLGILLIIDFYTFRGVRQITSNWNITLKMFLAVIFWLVPAFISFMTFYIAYNVSNQPSGEVNYRVLYTIMGVLVLFYVPKLIFSAFQLGGDLINAFLFISKKFNIFSNISNIRLLRNAGGVLALFMFIATLHGIVFGRYYYKTNNIQLEYPNLPTHFNGFKIVQISDWHIGSYYGHPERIEEAVKRINALNPDILVFTGDLVNNISTEVDEFIPVLQKLKAKYGTYSILGNHDYGDYVRWKSDTERNANIERLKKIEAEVGFKMLNNKSEILEIEGDKIALIGVENWGLPPFPQHGNLNKALTGLDSIPFKILLSHDPSHWDAEVKGKTNIDLTLSGHTHGMQFGFILKNFKWSPVKFKYPRWAGLYTYLSQKLYVNVGIGYIGFPGRVGIRPEIAVFELVSKK